VSGTPYLVSACCRSDLFVDAGVSSTRFHRCHKCGKPTDGVPDSKFTGVACPDCGLPVAGPHEMTKEGGFTCTRCHQHWAEEDFWNEHRFKMGLLEGPLG